MLATIPIKHIAVGERLRSAGDAQVASLVESIRDVGVLNPITVYPRKVIVDNVSADGYGIVAGLHRYTACKELGLEEIPAHIVTMGELERQIAECDENLCGPRLTPSEKALFTRRRKEAYEALHGPAKENRARTAAEARWSEGEEDASRKVCAKQSFEDDTASKTGQSKRLVQLNAERGEKIDEEVFDMIRDTHLDSGAYMDKIKGLSHVEQRAKVRQDLDQKRRDEDAELKRQRDDHEARSGATWLADAVGHNNLPALVAILESVPVKKLCAELRRNATRQ